MRKLCVIVLIISFIITGCRESNNSVSAKSNDSVLNSITTSKESTTTSETTTTKASQTNSKSEQTSDSNNYNELIIGCWKETQGTFYGYSGYIKFSYNGAVVDPFTEKNDGTYSINSDTIIIEGDKYKEYEIVKLTSESLELKTYDKTGETILLVFVRQGPNAEDKNKFLLSSANNRAKLIFTTLNNTASDLIADNDDVDAIKTKDAEAVETFKDSSDPLKTAVYEAMKDNIGTQTNLGYAYISYDPNNEKAENYVQWSETKQGSIIGQYPNPTKSIDANITFGAKH